MFNRILVPTDGSPLASQAVTAAIEFARGSGREIVALSVAYPFPKGSAEAIPVADIESELGHTLAAAHAHVEAVARQAAAAGVPCAAVTAVGAFVHEQIIEAARSQQCDVIFIASHGRRGLSRLIAGSVTQHVLSDTTIPVMVFRAGNAAAGAS